MSKHRDRADKQLQEVTEGLRVASTLLKHMEAKKEPKTKRTGDTPHYKIEAILPKDLPEIRQEMVEWTSKEGPRFWYEGHIRGSNYYIPPGLRHLPLKEAIARLAANQAQVLKEGKLFSVTPEMTFLAQKTSMSEFNLTLDMLPSPRGFIVWQQPVGQCEHTERMRLLVDRETGDIEEASIHEWVEGMGHEDIPVLGASWELLPGEDQVMVIFYSSREGLVNNFPVEDGIDLHEVRASLPPLIFEREQLLPVGQASWFTSQDADRLQLTARAAARPGLSEDLKRMGDERDEAVLPMVQQMTKTLVASWMLMTMRFAKRDVEMPDRASRKRLKRAGVSEESINQGVQVIKIGRPLRSQKPTEGEPAYRWKKRRIVGPFVRQQWYPSEDRHKPKLIEPYIAGPEGAPIGNAEKVYLLSE